MPPFQFIDPYPDIPENTKPKVVHDYDIYSDLADQEMLDLVREVEHEEVSSIQRELSDCTIELQERMWSLWERFCQPFGKEPEHLLLTREAKFFMVFLEWYKKGHPRAAAVTTFESLWKAIRELYYDKAQRKMPDEVGTPVVNYLQTKFAEKHSLRRGMLQTYTVGHHTLMGMLHYHWTFDTTRFPLERERLQMPTVLLFLAYTGARPGAIVESTSYRKTGQALLYRDLKLKLLQPGNGSSLLVLEITIRLDKGRRKRPSPKTITLYENRQCPAMCPIVHFLGLAFADKAFHVSLLERGLSPHNLHSFTNPEGRITIEFKFRDSILDIPVFRAWHSQLNGTEIHPTRALSAGYINTESTRLGRLAGLPHSFRPYCLRREVGTQLTDRGVSDQQRNQILGHARSETFLKHYISSSVVVDVQATYLGLESRSDLIKEVGKLTLRRDPNLPRELSSAQKIAAHQQPILLDAQKRYAELSQELKHRHIYINKAPADCPKSKERKGLGTTITSLKLKYERLAFKELLDNFHSNADLEHMVLQLKGDIPLTQQMLAPLQHSLPDRDFLANILFLPANDASFALIVEAMARLCKSVEPISNSNKATSVDSQHQHMNGMMTPDKVPSMVQSLDKVPLANQISLDDTVMNNTDKLGFSPPTQPPRKSTARQPRLLPRNVCLFCYKPETKPHHYKRMDHLRKHYQRVHFRYMLGSYWCPVLGCNTIIDSPDRFCNHAKTVHRSDLGVRASIMNANAHRTRPGQLQAFRLG